MKKLLLLLPFSLLSLFLSAQSTDCASVEDGHFLVVAETGNTEIHRKGSKQYEYGRSSGLKLVFKVKWLDECTYELKLKKVVENPKKLPIPTDMVVTSTIVEVTNDYYKVETTSNLFDEVLEFKILRLTEM